MRNRSRTSSLYLITSMAAITAFSTGAAGQEQVAGSKTPTQLEASGQDPGDGSALQDIVVTAQRRDESLQKVPLTVSIVGGEQLSMAGSINTTALTSYVPGLNISSVGATALVFLRGVGNSNLSVGDESAVSTYIDGIYQSSPVGLFTSLSNIKSIEVIKGPQGTLFGRNATGGVINITTKDPQSDPFAQLDLTYGNYQTVTTSAYMTSGVTDNLSADVSLYYNNQNKGWGHNLFNGEEVFKTRNIAARSKWLYENAGTRIVLSLDYHKDDHDLTQLRVVPPATLVGQPAFPGFYNINSNDPTAATSRSAGGSLTAQQDLGFATVKSITSYHRARAFNILDQDATASTARSSATNLTLEIPYFLRTFTQEVQLLSTSDSRIDWVAGTYFYRSDAAYDRDGFVFRVVDPIQTTVSNLKTTSYAAFGQATAEIVDDLKLTLGARYTVDRRELTADRHFLPSGARPAGFPTSAKKDFPKLTYRLAIDYQIAPTVLLFASWTRGFKSGFYNTGSPFFPGTLVPFVIKPEVLDAAEGGIKSQMFDSRLRMNASVFHYDYKGLQVAQNVQGAVFVSNAASARIYGLDVDITAMPTRRLSISVSGEYLNAKFTDFPNAPIYTLNPAGGDFSPGSFNAKGNYLLYSPKFSGRVSADYSLPTDVGDFKLSADYYYNDGFARSVDNRLWQSHYSLVTAALSWTSPDDGLQMSLWGRNLTGTKYYSYAVQTAPYGDHGSPATPRTYGVTLTAKFGDH